MPAGTVIEYGENSEMIIKNPGLTDGYDESKQDTSMDSKLFLPTIQSGLRVSYDEMKNVFKVASGYTKNGVSYGSFDGSYYHN